MTLDKIKSISKLINTGLDGAEDEVFCLIGESQRQDLLAIDELVNKFYNNGSSPLTTGKPINFYGITWVPIGVGTDILPKSGKVRSIMAFTKQAIGLAIGQDLKTYIDRLPTRTQSIQLYTNVLDGAVRIYDDQVVKINCVEA